MVVAAGNGGRDNDAGTNGYGTITSPGNDPYVITVGAMNTRGTSSRTDDMPASYSSKGPTLWDQVAKPDLVAPGNLIVSVYTPGLTLSQELPGNDIPTSLYQVKGTSTASNTYFILSGSSMAAPMVTGTAALMLQKNPCANARPGESAADVDRVQGPADGQHNQGSDHRPGLQHAGGLVYRGCRLPGHPGSAGQHALPANTTGNAMSPAVTVDSHGNVVLAPSVSLIWGGSTTWANTAVWGNSVLSGTNTQGRSMLWGTSTISGNPVLWGNSTVNPASVLGGTSVLWGRSAGSTADLP